MKFLKLIWIMLYLICLFFNYRILKAEVVEKIIGTIDEKVYTVRDMEALASDFGLKLEKGDNPFEEELKKEAFLKEIWSKFVEREILEKEAQRLGVGPKNEEIQKLYEEVKRRYGLNDQQMEDELKKQNFTPEGYKRYLKAQLQKTRIIELLISPKLKVSESELMSYYEAHRDRYKRPLRIRLSQIFISFSGRSEEEAYKLVERVFFELKGGKTFEEVAKAYSDDPSARFGGDIGYVESEEVDPSIWEEIKDLQIGEVSLPIRSKQGVHIFHVSDREEEAVIPFNEVRSRVLEDWWKETIEKEYVKWLEEMKRKYKVRDFL